MPDIGTLVPADSEDAGAIDAELEKKQCLSRRSINLNPDSGFVLEPPSMGGSAGMGTGVFRVIVTILTPCRLNRSHRSVVRR